ncbi:MAG: Gfo/Idh/MocA family oxidoreductase [Candidatus Hydrogenedentes bacterium]|nr:Gfo/Idh/MocA family oxidoreductase [Candidatus Hydrogenedentota bacterium]MBI3118601.1 Gfo/Idh/MocA family oxidoreductase [Candidatus Hydrogenedentota bacterium]
MSETSAGGMSRREFTKASAFATFAILSARGASAQANADTLRVGLIGCGGRGTGAAINHLTENENVVIVALADAFEDRLKSCRQTITTKEGLKGKADVTDEMCFVGLDAYQKLLATDVQLILHATPPYARPTHIAAAVDAGKHIFTEKPIAVDPTGVRLFIDAANKAKEKNLSFVTGTQRRHQKSYLDTIKKIQDGAVGDILAARSYWCGGLPFSHERKPEWNDLEYRLRNWYNQCWTCGDNIVEQHIHNLDVINWVLGGHPEKVFASGGRAWKPNEERYGDIWDQFSCDYTYPNGVHVMSMSRHWNDSAGGVFEEVTGTKGKSNCRDMGEDDKDPYVQEHIDLVKSIRGEIPYINEGVQTAESTMTSIMGRMSAYTGQELTWEEALNADLDIVPKDLAFEKEYPLGPIPVPGIAGKKAPAEKKERKERKKDA